MFWLNFLNMIAQGVENNSEERRRCIESFKPTMEENDLLKVKNAAMERQLQAYQQRERSWTTEKAALADRVRRLEEEKRGMEPNCLLLPSLVSNSDVLILLQTWSCGTG